MMNGQSQITGMFDRIAPSYDRLNLLLSAGVDHYWRRQLASHLEDADSILDVAAGTGDQLLANLKVFTGHGPVVGLDLSEKMLEIARTKKELQDVPLICGSADALPFQSDTFEALTISFGIRNVVAMEQGLQEFFRVLKPGGRCLILEFGLPGNPMVREGYLFYFRHVLPKVGALLSGDPGAYTYLNESAEHFPCGNEFLMCLEKAGFEACKAEPLTAGIAYIYTGRKPFE